MMDEMEIVVEKQECEEPAILVHDGSVADRLPRLMLDEGADRKHRKCRIREGDEVDERIDAAKPRHPDEDRDQADEMQQPCELDIAVAAPDEFRIFADKADDGKC